MNEEFDYTEELQQLNYERVEADLEELMTGLQDWWPVDYGHYGPPFIRMAWHSAGIYHTHDGHGGTSGRHQRLPPISSWPDNVDFNKVCRLLWPVKKKYGDQLSRGDLIVPVGNVALKSMGFETLGFTGGRADDYVDNKTPSWSPEDEWKMTSPGRFDEDGSLKEPFGSTVMGLIYIDSEGPNGESDPEGSAKNIHEAFSDMAMNDKETVALIASDYTFGKVHGADFGDNLETEPKVTPIEEQDLGWRNNRGSGRGPDTITSGIEGSWTSVPTQRDVGCVVNLFDYEWETHKDPGDAWRWRPTDESSTDKIPDVTSDTYLPDQFVDPMMLTTDIALKKGPDSRVMFGEFREDPEEFQESFAKAWYKLLRRDMGLPSQPYGPEVPDEAMLWQNPTPDAGCDLINDEDVTEFKAESLDLRLSVFQLVKTVWASASTYHDSDKHGGTNGAHIHLEPQRSQEVNEPDQFVDALGTLEKIQESFNGVRSNDARISLAGPIVLGGVAVIEEAAADAGYNVEMSFKSGWTDASQEQTGVESSEMLKPDTDGFRNYIADDVDECPEDLLTGKASLLNLPAREMIVLVGGMRALGTNYQDPDLGILTDGPEMLTDDSFENLLDMDYERGSVSDGQCLYEVRDREMGEVEWETICSDLVFGSNSRLRAIVEVYGGDDGEAEFVGGFVAT